MRTTIFRSSIGASSTMGAHAIGRRLARLAIGAAPLALVLASAGAQGPAMPSQSFRLAVRPGEINAAPYIDRDGGPAGAGTLVGTSELSVITDASDREHFELGEDVYITLPVGVIAAVGQRFYTFRLSDSFGEHGQVVVPTGVVVVRTVGEGKQATTARIVQEFSKVARGQGVLALDTSSPLPSGSPAPVENGLNAKVEWVENAAVAPTVQYYVVLSAGERQGVQVGDRFTLYRPLQPAPEYNTTLPPSDIAVAEVVRVTPFGATGLIISQAQPDISPGVAARLTAKMP